jgi:hypothetical protein
MDKIEKTIYSKPWFQNNEPKTMDVDYSKSLHTSLFYFIWLFGFITIYLFIYILMENIEKIMGQESWD